MVNLGYRYFQFFCYSLLLTLLQCNLLEKNEQNGIEEKVNIVLDDSSKGLFKENIIISDTLEVIVVQCANGYEYSIYNYDFNPIIENELAKFQDINVNPFPLKKLMGVPYQGVFDIKYCPPIIEKVNADFLILTRFDKKFDELKSDEMKWGYEVRIVNTEAMEQVNSISAHNLDSYQEIENHIKDNIEKLVADIEKLK